MKRILLVIAAIAAFCNVMMSAPAKPNPFIHTQSDGTTVTLVMSGGEFNHSLTTLDGLTVALDVNGDYCYTAGGCRSAARTAIRPHGRRPHPPRGRSARAPAGS